MDQGKYEAGCGILCKMPRQYTYVRRLRLAVQLAVLAALVHAGWRFYLFVLQFVSPGADAITRPPSVEGFLPIGGFMATKLFVFTGIVDPIHPAGFFIFAGAVLTAVLARKGFCSWVCPGISSTAEWRRS